MNQYYTPAELNLQDYYVGRPIGMIAELADRQQKEFDTAKGLLDDANEKLVAKHGYVTEDVANELNTEISSNLANKATELQSGKLSPAEMTSYLKGYASRIQNDPAFQGALADYNLKNEIDKLVSLPNFDEQAQIGKYGQFYTTDAQGDKKFTQLSRQQAGKFSGDVYATLAPQDWLAEWKDEYAQIIPQIKSINRNEISEKELNANDYIQIEDEHGMIKYVKTEDVKNQFKQYLKDNPNVRGAKRTILYEEARAGKKFTDDEWAQKIADRYLGERTEDVTDINTSLTHTPVDKPPRGAGGVNTDIKNVLNGSPVGLGTTVQEDTYTKGMDTPLKVSNAKLDLTNKLKKYTNPNNILTYVEGISKSDPDSKLYTEDANGNKEAFVEMVDVGGKQVYKLKDKYKNNKEASEAFRKNEVMLEEHANEANILQSQISWWNKYDEQLAREAGLDKLSANDRNDINNRLQEAEKETLNFTIAGRPLILGGGKGSVERMVEGSKDWKHNLLGININSLIQQAFYKLPDNQKPKTADEYFEFAVTKAKELGLKIPEGKLKEGRQWLAEDKEVFIKKATEGNPKYKKYLDLYKEAATEMYIPANTYMFDEKNEDDMNSLKSIEDQVARYVASKEGVLEWADSGINVSEDHRTSLADKILNKKEGDTKAVKIRGYRYSKDDKLVMDISIPDEKGGLRLAELRIDPNDKSIGVTGLLEKLPSKFVARKVKFDELNTGFELTHGMESSLTLQHASIPLKVTQNLTDSYDAKGNLLSKKGNFTTIGPDGVRRPASSMSEVVEISNALDAVYDYETNKEAIIQQNLKANPGALRQTIEAELDALSNRLKSKYNIKGIHPK